MQICGRTPVDEVVREEESSLDLVLTVEDDSLDGVLTLGTAVKFLLHLPLYPWVFSSCSGKSAIIESYLVFLTSAFLAFTTAKSFCRLPV